MHRLPRDFVDDPLPVTQGGILMLVQDIVGHNRLINDTIISHPEHVDVNYMIIPRVSTCPSRAQSLTLSTMFVASRSQSRTTGTHFAV